MNPFFCRHEGSVDERLTDVDTATFVQILRQLVGDAPEDAGSDPLLESPVAGLVWRISLG